MCRRLFVDWRISVTVYDLSAADTFVTLRIDQPTSRRRVLENLAQDTGWDLHYGSCGTGATVLFGADPRVRYNQLYWADLPYAGESQDVIEAMIRFREQLISAERDPSDKQAWDLLNLRLIELSNALRQSTPRYPLQPAPQRGAAEQ